jgi:hypothetical protein
MVFLWCGKVSETPRVLFLLSCEMLRLLLIQETCFGVSLFLSPVRQVRSSRTNVYDNVIKAQFHKIVGNLHWDVPSLCERRELLGSLVCEDFDGRRARWIERLQSVLLDGLVKSISEALDVCGPRTRAWSRLSDRIPRLSWRLIAGLMTLWLMGSQLCSPKTQTQ